jgi:hypothetical protein
MAAEKIGRRCFGLEYEPAYVDVTVRRWQAYTQTDAILEGDGRTFDEIAPERLATREAPSTSPSQVARAPEIEPRFGAEDTIELRPQADPIMSEASE